MRIFNELNALDPIPTELGPALASRVVDCSFTPERRSAMNPEVLIDADGRMRTAIVYGDERDMRPLPITGDLAELVEWCTREFRAMNLRHEQEAARQRAMYGPKHLTDEEILAAIRGPFAPMESLLSAKEQEDARQRGVAMRQQKAALQYNMIAEKEDAAHLTSLRKELREEALAEKDDAAREVAHWRSIVAQQTPQYAFAP